MQELMLRVNSMTTSLAFSIMSLRRKSVSFRFLDPHSPLTQ